MPVGGLYNIQWLDANAQRRYPLTAESSGVDTTGAFTLPDDFLVGLDLPVHAGLDVDPSRFFLKQLGVFPTGYSVLVGYQPASGDAVNVATALIARAAHAKNRAYALGGVAPFDDTVGKVVVGALDDIDEQPAGVFGFTLDTARLEVDAVRPILRGVSSLVVVNGEQASPPLYGDVQLVAGTNMQLVVVQRAGADPVVLFNAVQGEGTVEQCACTGDAAPSDPILRIDGVGPTPEGDFYLLGSDCLHVEATTNGLKLVVPDGCGKPCCGCAELEKITQDLATLQQQAATVQDFANRLRDQADTFNLVVLGSRLRDRGCS